MYNSPHHDNAQKKESYKRGLDTYFRRYQKIVDLERSKSYSQNRTKLDDINRDIINQRFELQKVKEKNKDKEKKLAEFYLKAYLHTHPQTVSSEAKYFTEVFISQNGKMEMG